MKRLFLFLLYLKVLNIVDVIIIKINSINGIFFQTAHLWMPKKDFLNLVQNLERLMFIG